MLSSSGNYLHMRAALHLIELLPCRALLHSLFRCQQQPKWTKTVVQYSSLCSASEERLALLPGNGASRISSRSSRSSGYTARGSQTPDLGTVRESAGSRGFFLHGRSTSRAAHPLQPVGVVLSTGRATQLSSCAASFDAAEKANGRPARMAKRLADNAAQPSTLLGAAAQPVSACPFCGDLHAPLSRARM